MSSYRAIASTETDPEAPITSALMKAFQDNLLATIEGDATAPRIYGAAMLGPAAGSTVQRDCLPWGTETTGPTNATLVSQVTASAMTALVACTVRVRLTFTRTIIGGSSVSVEVLKNGAAVQTYTTNQTGATTDVSLLQGETLAVRVTCNGAGTTNTATVVLSVCDYMVNATSAVMT